MKIMINLNKKYYHLLVFIYLLIFIFLLLVQAIGCKKDKKSGMKKCNHDQYAKIAYMGGSNDRQHSHITIWSDSETWQRGCRRLFAGSEKNCYCQLLIDYKGTIQKKAVNVQHADNRTLK